MPSLLSLSFDATGKMLAGLAIGSVLDIVLISVYMIIDPNFSKKGLLLGFFIFAVYIWTTMSLLIVQSDKGTAPSSYFNVGFIISQYFLFTFVIGRLTDHIPAHMRLSLVEEKLRRRTACNFACDKEDEREK